MPLGFPGAGMPIGPAGPSAPVRPIGPAGPVAPPDGPMGPVSPGSPRGPAGPAALAHMAFIWVATLVLGKSSTPASTCGLPLVLLNTLAASVTVPAALSTTLAWPTGSDYSQTRLASHCRRFLPGTVCNQTFRANPNR